MDLGFFNEIGKSIVDTAQNIAENLLSQNIGKDELELAEKLDAIEEYSVDRFEDDIAVLEDRKTGKIKNISQKDLPDNVEEGSILKCINGKFVIDEELTRNERAKIKEQMDNLWN